MFRDNNNNKYASSFVAFALLLPFFITPPAFSQAVSGNIFGTVLDSSGAAVPQANVALKNTVSGTSTKTATNETGNYSANDLAPGTYDITVDKTGFSTVVQQAVALGVGQSLRADVTLPVGQQTQQVTVSGTPAGIETDRAEVQTRLSADQISELPVLNRNFTNLTLLTPGATLNTFQQNASENPQQSTLVNTNGQEFAGTNYLLDGMNNNDTVLGITMVNPPIDSVDQLVISTSNYDAEYTQAGGAVVNISTRAGTNVVHGSAFEFLQNNIFQARDSFTQGLHDPGTPAPDHRGVPELRWNQFGGSVSGPVVRNKLFLFGDYQGTQRRIGASQSLRVPTAAERTGDLSDLGVPVYDPQTGNADGSGRLPFAGNIVPPSKISTPAANLLAALPQPNLTPASPAANNYATSGVELFDTNQFDIRGDQYISDKLRYFVHYGFLQASVNAPGPFGLYGGPAYPAWQFTGASNSRNQNVAGTASYTVNSTLLTDFRVGMSRYRVGVSALDSSQQLANTVGIPGLNIAGHPDTFGLPDLNINGTGGFSLGYSCNCPLTERETVLDFVNNWTKVIGNHTIKFGGTWETAWNQRLPSDNHRAGVYAFDQGVTSIAGNSSSGLGLASFLLGLPDSFQRFAQLTTTQEDRQNRMFYFVQDTWRVTRNLTINYGVRWDTWFPDFALNSGQGGRYDVTNNIVYVAGVGGVSASGDSRAQLKNFAPRLGIAYAFNDKTVLRTGYGRSYFQGTFGWNFNNLAADTYPTIVNQSLTSSSPFQSVFPLATAPPAPVFPAIPANGLLPLPDGVGVNYVPSNLKIPYADQWNFTLERAVARDLNVSVGYVGNIGRHLNSGFEINAAVPGPGPLDPRRPLFAKFGLTQPIFDKCDCTSSNYNSLQIRAEKRVSHGYSVLASYTYSKTMDFGEFGTPTDQYNARVDYGPADFDRTHVFTLAHTFELPFGKGRHFLSDAHGLTQALLGGWNFRGITSAASGLPFSPSLSNSGKLNTSTNNTGLNSDMSTRPNVIADPLAGISQNRNSWFNPAAYAPPGLFLFGSASRNSLRGPDYFEADWSLSKTFRFRERYALDARWEVFNAINRTNLGLPVTAVDSSAAGLIQDISPTATMRNMQFALHLAF
jgi:hypothetical protein